MNVYEGHPAGKNKKDHLTQNKKGNQSPVEQKPAVPPFRNTAVPAVQKMEAVNEEEQERFIPVEQKEIASLPAKKNVDSSITPFNPVQRKPATDAGITSDTLTSGYEHFNRLDISELRSQAVTGTVQQQKTIQLVDDPLKKIEETESPTTASQDEIKVDTGGQTAGGTVSSGEQLPTAPLATAETVPLVPADTPLTGELLPVMGGDAPAHHTDEKKMPDSASVLAEEETGKSKLLASVEHTGGTPAITTPLSGAPLTPVSSSLGLGGARSELAGREPGSPAKKLTIPGMKKKYTLEEIQAATAVSNAKHRAHQRAQEIELKQLDKRLAPKPRTAEKLYDKIEKIRKQKSKEEQCRMLYKLFRFTPDYCPIQLDPGISFMPVNTICLRDMETKKEIPRMPTPPRKPPPSESKEEAQPVETRPVTAEDVLMVLSSCGGTRQMVFETIFGRDLGTKKNAEIENMPTTEAGDERKETKKKKETVDGDILSTQTIATFIAKLKTRSKNIAGLKAATGGKGHTFTISYQYRLARGDWFYLFQGDVQRITLLDQNGAKRLTQTDLTKFLEAITNERVDPSNSHYFLADNPNSITFSYKIFNPS